MQWRKITEYRTSFTANERLFEVTAQKVGDDEFFAVEINNDYVADCAELPTREYLEQLVTENEYMADNIDSSTFRAS